jgi:hypothetical protein
VATISLTSSPCSLVTVVVTSPDSSSTDVVIEYPSPVLIDPVSLTATVSPSSSVTVETTFPSLSTEIVRTFSSSSVNSMVIDPSLSPETDTSLESAVLTVVYEVYEL